MQDPGAGSHRPGLGSHRQRVTPDESGAGAGECRPRVGSGRPPGVGTLAGTPSVAATTPALSAAETRGFWKSRRDGKRLPSTSSSRPGPWGSWSSSWGQSWPRWRWASPGTTSSCPSGGWDSETSGICLPIPSSSGRCESGESIDYGAGPIPAVPSRRLSGRVHAFNMAQYGAIPRGRARPDPSLAQHMTR